MLSWFNWHEPVFSPAQGAAIFAGVLALYLALKLVAWFLRAPSPDQHEMLSSDWEKRG